MVFFFKQKTAYEMRISDWSSDVCSSDLARLGGDEFAIVMEGIRGSGDTIRLSRRIVAALSEPVRINDKELFTATSIGIAIGGPDRSEGRRVGKEWVSTCRSRWSPYH